MSNTKRFSIAAGIGVLSLSIAAGVWAAKGSKHKGHEEQSGMMCPMHITGAKVKVKNTKTGVIIYITAVEKLPDVVKKIQMAAAHMKESKCCPYSSGKAHEAKGKKALWVCPMGDYEGPMTKDGRCPNCGMKLKKAKRAMKAATYVCPMGDYKGPKTKDGRCPECGMKLKKAG